MSMFLLTSFIQSVEAHVVVKPSEVGVGSWQTFTVGVPNEKESPVTEITVLIPDGVTSVSPNVKPGWKINVKRNGTGDDAKVTEIDWTNGSIPAGQRDEFMFNVQVPATETTLQWKAYQTYQDGTVVSWDQKPEAEESDDDSAKSGPYSETKVINDLKTIQTNTPKKEDSQLPLVFSIVAVALSAVALVRSSRK